jgi:hypothetical protein
MKWHYASVAAVLLLSATCAKAQTCIQQHSSKVATFCHYQVDIQDVADALPDGADAVWDTKVENGWCGKAPLDFLYIPTLKVLNDEIRMIELQVNYDGWHSAFALSSQFPARVWTIDDQWSFSPYHGWADQQDVMPAARVRMGCIPDPSKGRCSCCNGAEIVKTKFRVAGDYSDAWDWLNPRTQKWERVPDDIIHWDEPTPDKQGVAFEYPIGSGKLRCFFPPQEGGG